MEVDETGAQNLDDSLGSLARDAESGAIEVVLVDNLDLANGMATPLPYNLILLYGVEPASAASIADYDGWLRTLFIHEYAHILALDYRRGYSKVMRALFGRVGAPFTVTSAIPWFLAAPPNIFLPPWVHEGLSVNMETELTGRGRKDSTYYDMIYRADVAAGSVPPLDRLGGDFPGWPSYSTRYIYGAKLMSELIPGNGSPEERQLYRFGELIRHHGGRFPYAIDAPPRTLTGEDYAGLYERMLAGLEERYGPRIAALRAEGVTEPHIVASGDDFDYTGPAWLDDKNLLFTRSSPYGPTMLVKQRLGYGVAEEGGALGELARGTGESFSRGSTPTARWRG